MSKHDQALREQLVALLRGGSAHVTVIAALENFPAKLYGAKPDQAPHSAWEILEHMRIALHDLLDFCTKPEYTELTWPDDYWPKSSAPPSEAAWSASVEALQEDLKAFEDLIQDPKSNLYAEIPWATDHQTLLREVLLAGDHTSYHTGELVLLRRMLGAWKA
jgi:uncharacterized damage-inducible protein DinB